jgi:hypothetical protein
MSTPIIFPDVELWATDYLRYALPRYGVSGVFVSNRRESQKTAVWVRRDGGPTLDQVREVARLGVNVFAPSEQEATDLALTVSALLRAAADGDPVVRVEQPSGPSPVADNQPRRFMSFELTVRGTEHRPAAEALVEECPSQECRR